VIKNYDDISAEQELLLLPKSWKDDKDKASLQTSEIISSAKINTIANQLHGTSDAEPVGLGSFFCWEPDHCLLDDVSIEFRFDPFWPMSKLFQTYFIKNDFNNVLCKLIHCG
jgi:hypothetical protein